MESIQLWARHDEAVRQAIELGGLVHMEKAREELIDVFLLFAIDSGLLKTWVEAFPAPRCEPAIGMEVILPAHLAGRFARLYSLRRTQQFPLMTYESYATMHSVPASVYALQTAIN
jgi:hypothetical protein